MLNNITGILGGGTSTWLILAVIWSIPWKGVALWKSARLSHKWWFIIMLILNTFAILEIIYIFFVAKRYKVVATEEVKTEVMNK